MKDDRVSVLTAELAGVLAELARPPLRAAEDREVGARSPRQLTRDYTELMERAFAAGDAQLGDAQFSGDEIEALRRVDALLDDMDDPETPDLWSDDAVRAHPAWNAVRAVARDALYALGWDR